MAATIWSGHITFGLVSFPVELTAAARRIVLDFDLLHRSDGSPVKYVTYCKAEDQPVEKSEIVKGYSYEKGKYVLLEAEDFAKAAPSSAKVMEIQQFVSAKEVDPNLLDTSYFIQPKDAGARPYSLLFETLRRLDRWGVAQMAMHNREHLVVIRPGRKGLILHTLFYADELRNGEEYQAEPSNFRKQEQALAVDLVETLTGPLDMSQYRDGYRDRLEAVIEAKKRGKKIVATRPAKLAPVVDIMEALRQSIAAGKGKTKAAQKTSARVPAKAKTTRGRRAS